MLGSPQEQKPAPQESLIACFPTGRVVVLEGQLTTQRNRLLCLHLIVRQRWDKQPVPLSHVGSIHVIFDDKNFSFFCICTHQGGQIILSQFNTCLLYTSRCV